MSTFIDRIGRHEIFWPITHKKNTISEKKKNGQVRMESENLPSKPAKGGVNCLMSVWNWLQPKYICWLGKQGITGDYKGIQGNTRVVMGLQGNKRVYMALQGYTRVYIELHKYTREYKGLQKSTRVYRGSQENTRVSKGLQGSTRVYRG